MRAAWTGEGDRPRLSPSRRAPRLLYRELTVLNVAGTVSIMKNRTDIFASASVQQ